MTFISSVEKLLATFGYVKASRAWGIDITDLDKTIGMKADPYAGNYIKTYDASVWVYRCVKCVAETGAGIPLRFFYKKNDEEIDKGDFLELWTHINPFANSYDFRVALLGYIGLLGEVFVAHEKDSEAPTRKGDELFVLRPDKVSIRPDKFKKILGYVYNNGMGGEIGYLPEEITHFKLWNPGSDFRGLSPIRPGMQSLTVDFWASDWNKNFFKNSAIPRGLLNIDGDVDEDFLKVTREEWNKIYQGQSKAHRLAILGRGSTFQDVTKSIRDMDFVNLKKMSREEIIGLWNVPPVLVGLFEYANYANANAQIKIFWQFTMQPVLKLVETVFNEVLIPKVEEGIYCEHDLSDVDALKENELLKAKTGETLAKTIMTINEVRERLYDYPPVEWGEERVTVSAGLALPKGKTDTGSKTMTAEQIEMWNLYSAKLTDSESGFEEDMVKFFTGQEKRVLKKFDEFFKGNFFRDEKFSEEQIDLLFNVVDEIKRLKNASDSTLRRILRASAERTLLELNIDIAFDLAPAVEKWVEAKALKLSGVVNQTTKRKIKQVLVEGIEGGKPIEVMRKDIQGVFKDATKNRARMIARTETNSTANKGIIEGWRASDVVEKKIWLTAPGAEFPRHYLVEGLNGQERGLDEDFMVMGELLDHPGDVVGSAKNVINCRCTMLAKVKE